MVSNISTAGAGGNKKETVLETSSSGGAQLPPTQTIIDAAIDMQQEPGRNAGQKDKITKLMQLASEGKINTAEDLTKAGFEIKEVEKTNAASTGYQLSFAKKEKAKTEKTGLSKEERMAANAEKFANNIEKLAGQHDKARHAEYVDKVVDQLKDLITAQSIVNKKPVDEKALNQMLGNAKQNMLKDKNQVNEVKKTMAAIRKQFAQENAERATVESGKPISMANKWKGGLKSAGKIMGLMLAQSVAKEIFGSGVERISSPMISAVLMSTVAGIDMKSAMMYSFGFGMMGNMLGGTSTTADLASGKIR